MGVFRINKNRNYTAMSNYHLRDPRLSLRTVGLLSKMLALPDSWEFSERGLVKICKDGAAAVHTGLKELEEYGYLERTRERGERGRLGHMIYDIYEIPKKLYEEGDPDPEMPIGASSDIFSNHNSPRVDSPCMENQDMDNPDMDDPDVDSPILGKPNVDHPTQGSPNKGNRGQRNNNKLNTKQPNTQKTNIYSALLENQSIHQSDDPVDPEAAVMDIWDRLIDGRSEPEEEKPNGLESYNHWVDVIKKQINYNFFTSHLEIMERRLDNGMSLEEYDEEYLRYDPIVLDEIVSYMADTLNSTSRQPIKVGGTLVDREVLKQRLLQASSHKISDIIYALKTTAIKNRKSYALSMLYN